MIEAVIIPGPTEWDEQELEELNESVRMDIKTHPAINMEESFNGGDIVFTLRNPKEDDYKVLIGIAMDLCGEISFNFNHQFN